MRFNTIPLLLGSILLRCRNLTALVQASNEDSCCTLIQHCNSEMISEFKSIHTVTAEGLQYKPKRINMINTSVFSLWERKKNHNAWLLFSCSQTRPHAIQQVVQVLKYIIVSITRWLLQLCAYNDFIVHAIHAENFWWRYIWKSTRSLASDTLFILMKFQTFSCPC